MPRTKTLFLILMVIICRIAISQENKSAAKKTNTPQKVIITGKAYITLKTLTGVQGAYNPDAPPPSYRYSDTLPYSERVFTYISKSGKQTPVRTDKKGVFTTTLTPGHYFVYQPEPLAGNITGEFGFHVPEIDILKNQKFYKILFSNSDDSENTIPKMSR